ncbi:hypothetical protein VTG60DRAFT_2948 [Thermothelomyces hinnuleus]
MCRTVPSMPARTEETLSSWDRVLSWKMPWLPSRIFCLKVATAFSLSSNFALERPKKSLKPCLMRPRAPAVQMALDGIGKFQDGGIGTNDVLKKLLDRRIWLPVRLGPLIVQAVVVTHDDHDLADVAQTGAEEGVEVVVGVDGSQGELDGVPGHADALGSVFCDKAAGGDEVLNVLHDVGNPRGRDLDVAHFAASILLPRIALQQLGGLFCLLWRGSLAQELVQQLRILGARGPPRTDCGAPFPSPFPFPSALVYPW